MDSALRTQEEFSRKCIVVSQLRSAVEAGLGDCKAALETQVLFASEIDAVPVLSQIKSAVQAGCGDMDSALRTQENFSKECLVVSQLRSVVEASLGDHSSALQTQKQFLEGHGLAQLGFVGGSILFPLLTTVSILGAGFEAGGILLGSPAAALMSSYGGNVTSGSLCAILQSIGASGMSSGVSASLGLVGGGIGSTLLISNPVSEEDNDSNPVSEEDNESVDFDCEDKNLYVT